MSTSDTPWRNPAASTEPVAESAALMQRVRRVAAAMASRCA